MRTYVVTGSESGIGAQLSTLLRKRGDLVIGVDITNTAEVTADLTTAHGRDVAVEKATALSGGVLDGVIACAGLGGGKNQPAQVMAVNYFGAIALLEGLRGHLERGENPRAAVVSSIDLVGGDDAIVNLCLQGLELEAIKACKDSGSTAYNASKRAVAEWVRRQATTEEWAGQGIALNAVAPGVLDTPMSAYLITPDQKAKTLRKVPQPYGGIQTPESVASLLDWLTGVENTFLTGQVIFIDGGFEAEKIAAPLPRRDLSGRIK